MNTLTKSLQDNLTQAKKILPAEDILTYEFQTADKVNCAIVYADGMVNKQLLGDLIARPLSRVELRDAKQKNSKNEGGRSASTDENQSIIERIEKTTLFPELKQMSAWSDITIEVLDGNSLLLVDGVKTGLIVGANFCPSAP